MARSDTPTMPQTSGHHHKQSAGPYALIAGSWVLYAALAMLAPAGTTPHASYQLAPGLLNAIRLTILLPLLAFWLIAVYGAQSFRNYADIVAGSPEERPLRLVSLGLYLTLVYFVVGAVFGSALNFYTQSPGYGSLIVLHDHLSAFITLAAFAVFFAGGRQLRSVASITPSVKTTVWITATTSVLAVGFAWRFLTMPEPTIAAAGNSLAYVPRSLLLFTLIAPYFLAWCFGALAVADIVTYARHVRGVLYRQALRQLAKGVCLVIGFSTLGGILTLVSATVAGLSLGPILLILYLALLLYGAGYALVAAGARKLARIELVTAGR